MENPRDGTASAKRDRLDQLGGGIAAEVEVLRDHVAENLIIK